MSNPLMTLEPTEIEKGKPLALLSYASVVIGFPVFVLPMLQKDNAYALQHAKWAGAYFAIYVAIFLAVLVVSFITCGFGTILVPVVFLPWVLAGLGALNALNGKTEAPPLAEPLATMMFAGVLMPPTP